MNESELRRRFPEASASFIQANADGVCAAHSQSVEGNTLEHSSPGKTKSRKRIDGGFTESNSQPVRSRITFRVFSVRPADWDGYHIKECQDLLVHAGAIPGDAWHQLEGRVVSEKVHSKAEEKTEITIEPVT